MRVTPPEGTTPASIALLNSDGSEAEISGNGTRCAAALLVDAGLASEQIDIRTGAGLKHLRLVHREGRRFIFEMNMGLPKIAEGNLHFQLPTSLGTRECTILDVGNPQCAFFVDSFEWDWKAFGAEIERHAHFPRRTNVSFIRVVDRTRIDVRYWERGAGFTMSSGTGSTGAFFAAHARGLIDAQATVDTLAGPLSFRIEGDTVMMQGPAEITTRGTFYFGD